jgi:hypothetical protein
VYEFRIGVGDRGDPGVDRDVRTVAEHIGHMRADALPDRGVDRVSERGSADDEAQEYRGDRPRDVSPSLASPALESRKHSA